MVSHHVDNIAWLPPPVFFRIPIIKDLRYIHRSINSDTMFAKDPTLEQFYVDDHLLPKLPKNRHFDSL